MLQNQYSYITSPSALVQVAEIASRYKNQTDKLMEVIHAVQKVVPSIAEDVAAVIAREMGLSQNHVYSFVTFYEYLLVKPHGKYTIRMCSSAPCHVRGAKEVIETISNMLGIQIGETTADNRFTIELCPCLGICDTSPAVMINGNVYGDLNPESARELINRYIREDV